MHTRILIATLCLVGMSACGSDTVEPSNNEPADVSADGGDDDGNVTADVNTGQDTSVDSGGAADTAVADTSAGEDTATATDSGAGEDTAGDDSGVEDGGAADTTSDDASADTAGGEDTTSGADTAAQQPSCSGAPLCKSYATNPSMGTCSGDPGCKGANYTCKFKTKVAPCNGLPKSACLGLTQGKCIWSTIGCAQACTKQTTAANCGQFGKGCAWEPKSCDGYATKLACSAFKTKSTCSKIAGCTFSTCVPSKEVCDGVDNNCDGQTDEATTPDGAICDDGDPCTEGNACKAGKCDAGKPVTCPAKACNTVACVQGKGCEYTPTSGACEDGNPCTDNDACNAGKCEAGAAKDCDDNNPCTVDSCVVSGGKGGSSAVCKKTPDTGKKCDDGQLCTDKDACDSAGKCSGAPKDCNAGISGCKEGTCEAATGSCKVIDKKDCKTCKTTTECNDGKACTNDSCTNGACVFAPKSGCVEPTNIEFTAAASANGTYVNVGLTPVTLALTFKNTGKAITNIYVAVNISWDGNPKAIVPFSKTKKWTKTIGQGQSTAYQVTGTLPQNLPQNMPSDKLWACATYYYYAPSKKTKTKCLPIEKVQWPDFSLKSLKLTKVPKYATLDGIQAELQWTADATFIIPPKSVGYALGWKTYLSKDDKCCANDKQAGVTPTNVTLKSGWTLPTKPVQLFVKPPNVDSSAYKFFCAEVTSKVDSDLSNNTKCVPLTWSNAPDIVPKAIKLLKGDGKSTVTGINGKETAVMKAGQGPFTCQIDVTRGGSPTPIDKPVTGRCWVTTVKNSKWSATANDWSSEAGQVDASKATTTVAAALKTTFKGEVHQKLTDYWKPRYLCGEVNYDKSTSEAFKGEQNNIKCINLDVSGVDLLWWGKKAGTTSTDVYTKLKTSTLSPGGSSAYYAHVANSGDVGLKPTKGFPIQVWMSKDNKLSGDDVKITELADMTWAKSSTPVCNGDPATKVPSCSGAVVLTKEKFTVPAGTAPGSYYAIFVINYNKTYAEPAGNNAYAYKFTVK